MRAVAIYEYDPAEAKLAQADDSTANDSSEDSATPVVRGVIDDESQLTRQR
jgi:hypothetical protein